MDLRGRIPTWKRSHSITPHKWRTTEQVDAHAAPSLIPPLQLLIRRNFLADWDFEERLEQWEGAGGGHNVFSRLSDPTEPIKGNNL